ncbi:MAG: PDZ domain-containing protein [Planctomycetota bacterium]
MPRGAGCADIMTHPAGRLTTAAIIVLAFVGVHRAPAQFDGSMSDLADEMRQRSDAKQIESDATEAFQSGDYLRAAGLYGAQAKLRPASFVAFYNLACALANAGELPLAEQALKRSIELGFTSLTTLRTDPDLAPLRETVTYDNLVNDWPGVLDAGRPATRDRAARWIDRKPNERSLDALRIDLISARNDRATDAAATQLERVAAWTNTALFSADDTVSDADAGEQRDPAMQPWVAVVLPDERDFRRWVLWTFGRSAFRGSATNVGGAYEHDQKRLVAQDTGATLRHEAVHVFHWRDMERLGQTHPIWIQEGLASLVEDMDPPELLRIENGGPHRDTHDAQRGWVPVASWRTNIAKRLADRRRLTPIETLAQADQRTFTTRRPLRQYAEARALLLFLLQRGHLSEWYATYTRDTTFGYATDPSGIAALEHTLGMPERDIHAAWTDWARDELPLVPESFDDLGVTLGLDVQPDASGGPRITSLTRATRRETDLRMGDVIIAMNGRPINEVQELVRVLAAREPGDGVILTYRRGKLFGETRASVRRTP